MLLPIFLSEEVAKPIFTKVAKKVFPVEKLNLWIEALSISLKRCKVCQEIGKFQYATFAMFSMFINLYIILLRRNCYVLKTIIVQLF